MRKRTCVLRFKILQTRMGSQSVADIYIESSAKDNERTIGGYFKWPLVLFSSSLKAYQILATEVTFSCMMS